MAGMTDLGGLFVKLGLAIDKNSFETGNKMIDGMTTGFSKLIGVARNAAVVLTGTAVASGTVESTAYKTSRALGISTESLDTWKAAAKIAGVNANSLVSSMGQLGNVLSHIQIDGSGLDAYSTKLTKLGIGITDLKDKEGKWLSADEAYKKIITKGQSAYNSAKTDEERLRITTIMGDILGEAGQSFFIELQRQKKTIDQFLNGAGKTVFTTASDNANGQNFLTEFNTLRASIESLSKLFGDDIARELTPAIQGINKWLEANGESIKIALNKIAGTVGDTTGTLGSSVGATKAIFDYLRAEKGSPEQEEALERILKFRNEFAANKQTGWIVDFMDDLEIKKARKANLKSILEGLLGREDYTTKGKLDYNKVPERTQQLMLEYLSVGGSGSKFTNIPKIKDGIMRPDGTITQVAPDDWVLAARNVGDLARAFIPPTPTAGAGNMEFSIVQNFTINGGSDLPQILRQQAYNGTQQGLMEIMAQSSQRLQLMSGTR